MNFLCSNPKRYEQQQPTRQSVSKTRLGTVGLVSMWLIWRLNFIHIYIEYGFKWSALISWWKPKATFISLIDFMKILCALYNCHVFCCVRCNVRFHSFKFLIPRIFNICHDNWLLWKSSEVLGKSCNLVFFPVCPIKNVRRIIAHSRMILLKGKIWKSPKSMSSNPIKSS